MELYIGKISFTKLEISVAFTDDIESNDIIKFGLQYKNLLEEQERRKFIAESALVPFKSCGTNNCLQYSGGTCHIRYVNLPCLKPREDYRYTLERGRRPEPEFNIPFVDANNYYKNLYAQYDHYIPPHQNIDN